MNAIVPNYVAGFIYGALVESFCSEQNARMMAMDAATDNADALLKDLNTMYNRARQAAITQEITEAVCGGAAAQRREREEGDESVMGEQAAKTKKTETSLPEGKIVQVSGPVVDVNLRAVPFRRSGTRSQ